MFVASYKGSARAAGLIRRLRQEQAEVVENLAILEDIEVTFPAGFDGDENISYSEVLQGSDAAKGARLKVNGKVTARAKVQSLVNSVSSTVNSCREVIADITWNLRDLGVKP